MRTTESNGKILVKQARRIVGFAWETRNEGWAYAFGKPSQSEYLAFCGDKSPLSREQAIERIKAAC